MFIKKLIIKLLYFNCCLNCDFRVILLIFVIYHVHHFNHIKITVQIIFNFRQIKKALNYSHDCLFSL